MKSVNELRRETPGLTNRCHFDNCGSSLMPQPVLTVLREHLELEACVGGYVAQERVSDRLEGLYTSLSRLFGGGSNDYAYTASAVDAWVRAFYSVPLTAGDNIVTSYNEYCSNFVAYLQVRDRVGVDIRVAPRDPDYGGLNPETVAGLIDERTKLISLSHISSSSGEVTDVAAVGRITKAAGIPFLLDACQSAGQLPVNVDEIGCDMMTATGRKFLRGPRGTGFLYVSEQMRQRLDPVVLTNQSARWVGPDQTQLRDDARIFEGWERSVSGQLGLAAAADYVFDLGLAEATSATQKAGQCLRDALGAAPGVTVACPPGASAAIITATVDGMDADTVKATLERENIAVQVSRIEHTRLDLDARGHTTLVRLSPHYFTTDDEISRLVTRLSELAC